MTCFSCSSLNNNLIHDCTHVRSKECWFCLSSPNVESHLIISVGGNLYCALAKGPLVDDHVLLIPVEHSPSTLSLPPDCQRDLNRYQSSLRKYCKTQRKELIFFELISKRGTHANLQVRVNSLFISTHMHERQMSPLWLTIPSIFCSSLLYIKLLVQCNLCQIFLFNYSAYF